MGFPGGAVVKNLPASVRDTGSIPGSERSPGEENGTPLQYSCLENPMDREASWATVPRVAKSWTRLSDWAHTHVGSHLSLTQNTFVSIWIHFGEGNGNPLQYSCLENPRDRGAWWAAIYGVAQNRTWLKWLSSSSSRRHFGCHIRGGGWGRSITGIEWVEVRNAAKDPTVHRKVLLPHLKIIWPPTV